LLLRAPGAWYGCPMDTVVSIHMPAELLRAIEARAKDRDAFIQDALRRELARRIREDLRTSLENPHPESLEMETIGLDAFAQSLPLDDADALCDPSVGTPIRWVEGRGWVDGTE